MRILLATTALGAVAMSIATAAHAQQKVISTETTTPVLTSGEAVRITSTGIVKPAGGAAVTINTNNGVQNEGSITIRGANNSVGILANANVTSAISNSGKIVIDEDYTPTDTDNDGDLDGPFAQGSNRFGIRTAGAFTGNITNSGTITVEGNQSAGIALDGTLNGTLRQTGTISVLGNNSYGIGTGDVTGSVVMTSGSITTQGQNSVGILVGGDVSGAVVLQGTVNSTGYRYTTAPADPSKLDSDDLLQGGSAVVVAGDVGGGILLDVRPADNDTNDSDEDDDGIADAQEGNASLTSLGSAPALAIGSSSQDVAIGAVGSTGYGLVVKGSVTGNGVYDGVNATGIFVGGAQGHSVTIAGGANISGTVTSAAKKASATAIRIGADATVPTVRVSGTVRATSGGAEAAAARAVLIDSGATVNSVRNSGTIEAVVDGQLGSAVAITGRSGTLTLVENAGVIRASGGATRAIAIDLSANTSGTTVRQIAAASGKPAPIIAGDILFGTGNDTLQIQAGSLTGNVNFGGGADVFELNGQFQGQLLNSAGTAVTVGAGGLLGVTTAGAVNLGSLTTNGGAIGVTIGESGHTLYNVAGTASFGSGSTVVVTLQRVGSAEGSYTIVDAGTLTGGSNLTSSAVALPFLFTSSIDASETTGEVVLDIERKSDAELGLNASEAAVLDAALIAADNDLPVAGVFLGAATSAALKDTLQQLLPEHAGGAFETATRGPRLATRILADPTTSLTEVGGLGVWAQQVAWGTTKSIGSTSGYKLSGWGASMGAEIGAGPLGKVGVSLGYHLGKDRRGGNDLISSQYEGGVYWRGGVGPLRGFARAAAARLDFDSTRRFNAASVAREAEGEWSGTLYSGTAGVYYDATFGRFSLRPLLSLEHYSLKEDGYSESGGGDAFNLTVDSRSSRETAANAVLALGYELLSPDRSGTWMRLEVEGGRREIISSRLGSTTARFKDGDPFTLTPEERTSGWIAGLRAIGGGGAMSVAGEVSAEEQQGNAAVGGRLSVQFPF